MAKRLVTLCAMLLTSSVIYLKTINAAKFKVMKTQLPIEVIIDQRDPENPRAQICGVKDQLPSGLKWTKVELQQFIVAYDPENASEPVILIDLKKAILKLVANDSQLAQAAGITPADFANAGITEAELAALQQEGVGEEDYGIVSEVINDLVQGSSGRGIEHFLNGGADLMTGCGKVSLGSAILIRKAVGGIITLVRTGWDKIVQ